LAVLNKDTILSSIQ